MTAVPPFIHHAHKLAEEFADIKYCTGLTPYIQWKVGIDPISGPVWLDGWRIDTCSKLPQFIALKGGPILQRKRRKLKCFFGADSSDPRNHVWTHFFWEKARGARFLDASTAFAVIDDIEYYSGGVLT